MTRVMVATPVIGTSAGEARGRSERIRQGLESYAVLREDIATAYQERDWITLGYPSWEQYVDAEFTTAARLSLPREERRELVTYFRARGLSTRAIATATGASQKTVDRDVRAAGESCDSPAPSHVVGMDGKTYTPSAPESDVVEAEIVEEDAPAAARVRAPRRRPLPDQAKDAGWEIRRSADKLTRILADDRYPKNEEQVRLVLRGHLLFVAETVAVALEQLGNQSTLEDS